MRDYATAEQCGKIYTKDIMINEFHKGLKKGDINRVYLK